MGGQMLGMLTDQYNEGSVSFWSKGQSVTWQEIPSSFSGIYPTVWGGVPGPLPDTLWEIEPWELAQYLDMTVGMCNSVPGLWPRRLLSPVDMDGAAVTSCAGQQVEVNLCLITILKGSGDGEWGIARRNMDFWEDGWEPHGLVNIVWGKSVNVGNKHIDQNVW